MFQRVPKASFCWVPLVLVALALGPRAQASQAPSILSHDPPAYKAEEVQVGLSRGSCFGPCPNYSVQIFGDGTVTYGGGQHVTVSGSREAKIPQVEVAKLVSEFLAARFFEMPDSYTGFRDGVRFEDGQFVREGLPTPPDGPTTTLNLRLGSRRKIISIYGHYPDELRHLALLIDDLPVVRAWTGRKQ